jgi:hypothetical protein
MARGCLALAPQLLDFGDVVVNTTATGSVAVTNDCGTVVTVTVSQLSGTDSLLFATVPQASTVIRLEDGATTSVVVQYTPLLPRSTPDQAIFSLGLCESGTGCWSLVSLRGHGVETGITVDPSPLDFGFGVGPTTRCAALTNHADALIHLTADPAVLNVSSLGELTSVGPFQLGPPFPPPNTTIAAGETLLVCVTYTPPQCPGKSTGEIDISTDDAAASNITIPLAGFSGGAVILCSPPSLDFGLNACGTVSTLSILCTNIGQDVPGDPSSNLVFWGLSFKDGNPAFSAAFHDPLPDAGLAAGQSVKIDVTYAPIQSGAQSDRLLISTNDVCDPQPAIQVTAVCQ